MYVVEIHDPWGEHPHLSDSGLTCMAASLPVRLEEATGVLPAEALDMARQVVRGEDLDWTDPETGVEVTARRVGELVGGRS